MTLRIDEFLDEICPYCWNRGTSRREYLDKRYFVVFSDCKIDDSVIWEVVGTVPFRLLDGGDKKIGVETKSKALEIAKKLQKLGATVEIYHKGNHVKLFRARK